MKKRRNSSSREKHWVLRREYRRLQTARDQPLLPDRCQYQELIRRNSYHSHRSADTPSLGGHNTLCVVPTTACGNRLSSGCAGKIGHGSFILSQMMVDGTPSPHRRRGLRVYTCILCPPKADWKTRLADQAIATTPQLACLTVRGLGSVLELAQFYYPTWIAG